MMHNLIHRHGSFNMGDIGEEEGTEIELEPFPQTEPVKEPAAPSVVPEPVPA